MARLNAEMLAQRQAWFFDSRHPIPRGMLRARVGLRLGERVQASRGLLRQRQSDFFRDSARNLTLEPQYIARIPVEALRPNMRLIGARYGLSGDANRSFEPRMLPSST